MLLAPEIGTSEVLIIAAIALIVVGPKDLPMLLKRFGQLVGRMRNMANDFRSSFEDMARQSELDDLRKEVEAMRSAATDTMHSENAALTQSLNAGFENDSSYDAYADIFPPPPSEPETAPVETPKPARKRAPKKVAADAPPSEPVEIVAPKRPRKQAPAKSKAGDIVT